MENSCRKKYKPFPKKWILASRCTGFRRNSALIPANAGLFHYAGNNPIRYIDPDGREVKTKNNKSSKTSFIENFESDKFGREILKHYLYGQGVDKRCNSEKWQNYMRANRQLRLDIGTEVLANFNKQASSKKFEDSMTFTFSFHGELENTEKISGYSYLHGSNRDVGDVSVFVYAKQNMDNTVSFSYLITWNDIIDPNRTYESDIKKNKIAEIISLGQCKAYKIEIIWNDKLTIGGPEGFKFGE